MPYTRGRLCVIWILEKWSLIVAGINNLSVTEESFNWITMIAVMQRQTSVHLLIHGILVTSIVIATLIIMTAYIKVYRVVRRQVSLFLHGTVKILIEALGFY